MQEVYEFLKKCNVYYLATVDGGKPRVRPFGTYHLYGGRLYIQTGKSKDVSKQLLANPNVEISAFDGESGAWIRIAATVVDDPRVEAIQSMLDAFPMLEGRYAADDGNTQVLWLKDATATIESFSGEKKVVNF
ncbi:MAG: pyridoxamine 5'-phosphate oxidase family protein [Clostridiales Family XIII bacterium]|jgi:uncharacterized pyridoxamine 5'-phosphate oxidase family protein|nr:pyridoxamine 5'-phosphate oxidase family protein [Clostridiales Family XIII bacterium]